MPGPTNDPKTTRMDMRLSRDFVSRVDRWRGSQPDVPNRTEALRRLIERGLEAEEGQRALAG